MQVPFQSFVIFDVLKAFQQFLTQLTLPDKRAWNELRTCIILCHQAIDQIV